MDLQNISLAPIRSKRVAILGYGNQGRAHALCLRDSGVSVLVGARREGKAWAQAAQDGFSPLSIPEAVKAAEVVMFLLPDQVIPQVYAEVSGLLDKESFIGFAHGFALHYGLIAPASGAFLVGPKGAGAVLRQKFEEGTGLPGVFALSPPEREDLRKICLSYAKAIGCASSVLIETTFQEETECDLFGEQTVLCGGLMELMQGAFDTLVRHGHKPEMAFFECCFEARMIMELWLKYGPRLVTEKISPTAFYGGLTRGRRLVTDETRKEMDKIFGEIRSGEFAKEWLAAVRSGAPELASAREKIGGSPLQAVYEKLSAAHQAPDSQGPKR